MTNNQSATTMEILAPAGSPASLKAALEAGADAVYLGLKHLNARRGAANFLPENLPEVVKTAHAANAKVYLTLNIDLHQRELGLAARTLALAKFAGVDAVLVRDPALLALRQFFPEVAFHFSTQAAVTSSAGVKAAKQLGISRVVLAREMTGAEIASASQVPGVETEVFVQGALCFACSGRCLLSSWVGGRSGNRGACASPCRVLWSNAAGQTAHPLSMHDLCLLKHLQELRAAGVASLKIEGRLKSPEWVAKAVEIYRLAKDMPPEQLDELLLEAEKLGGYTGRKLTDGYFVGQPQGLTGTSARPASTPTVDEETIASALDDIDDLHEDEAMAALAALEAPESPDTPPASTNDWAITISEDERGAIFWEFAHALEKTTHRTAPQRIANAKRAIAVADVLTNMQALFPERHPATVIFQSPTVAERLLPRHAGKAAVDALAAFQRQARKTADGQVRKVKLAAAVESALAPAATPCPANRRQLGQSPDTCRLSLSQWQSLAPSQLGVYRRWIVACTPLTAALASQQAETLSAFPDSKPIAALPAIFYEEHLPALQDFLRRMRASGLTVEVNSWDGWQLATEAEVPMLAGPGMAVLNALAAKQLWQLGCQQVTVSSEIDQNQLENLCAAVAVPLNITVFARPALMATRALLPDEFAGQDNAPLTDSRGTTLRVNRSGELTILRSEQPFDWRSLRNELVKAAHFTVDLCGSPAPLQLRPAAATTPFLFNYDRRLR